MIHLHEYFESTKCDRFHNRIEKGPKVSSHVPIVLAGGLDMCEHEQLFLTYRPSAGSCHTYRPSAGSCHTACVNISS